METFAPCFYVNSEYGQLSVEVTTGKVVSCNVYEPQGEYLVTIDAFDIKEWEQRNGRNVETGMEIGILEIYRAYE